MRKRSKYRPRQTLQDPLSWVLNGLKPLTDIKEEHLKLLSKNHAAMDEVVHGRGTHKHMDVLISAANMAEALYKVRDDLGRDWATEIKAGQDALVAMARRGVSRGDKFLFTGPELAAVNLLLEIHDAQLAKCTVDQLERALRIVAKEILAKRARKINQPVVVC